MGENKGRKWGGEKGLAPTFCRILVFAVFSQESS